MYYNNIQINSNKYSLNTGYLVQNSFYCKTLQSSNLHGFLVLLSVHATSGITLSIEYISNNCSAKINLNFMIGRGILV